MKITHFLKKSLTIILPVLAIMAPTANVFADVDTPWGPDRTTFTWENPASYATFNSITNNPTIGDERNFVRVREVKDGATYGDEVTLERGKTYEVYIYYHNNASPAIGTTAAGIAEEVSLKSSFPATVKKGEQATVTATINTKNASPRSVWDGAYLKSTEDLYLRYVPGTAIIHNGGTLNGQSIGPDYLFGDGALLGYNKFSGILPGCNEYAGYITYQIFADAPDFTVSKTIVGDSSVVKAGDEITFKIRYDNTGTMNQENIVVRDQLPSGLTYVNGSTTLYNNNFTSGKAVNDDLVTEHGMNIGDYAGGSGWAEVTYKAKVNDSVKCGDAITNAALVSTNDGNKSADVTLVVSSEGCELPSELPNTGPVEIALAVAIVLGILGGGFYLWRSNRVLKKVESAVSGNLDQDIKAQNTETQSNPIDQPNEKE